MSTPVKHYGDKGTTKLLNGNLVSKASNVIRIEGKLDTISALLQETMVMSTHSPVLEKLTEVLSQIINLLIYFSNPNEVVTSSLSLFIEKMDAEINAHEKEHRFKYFSNVLSCKINVLRTFVRELECVIVEENDAYPLDENILIFVNRLSLYLFYLACDAN